MTESCAEKTGLSKTRIAVLSALTLAFAYWYFFEYLPDQVENSGYREPSKPKQYGIPKEEPTKPALEPGRNGEAPPREPTEEEKHRSGKHPGGRPRSY